MKKQNKSKQFLALALITTLFTSSIFAVSAGQVQQHLLEAADTKKSGAFVRDRFLSKMKKPFEKVDKKNLLLIGDSHAQDFLNGILENDFLPNYEISTRYISGRCQIFKGDKSAHKIAGKDRAYCAKSDTLSLAKDQIAEADVVILVADWKEWAAKELPQTIKNMALKPDQKLFVVGRKSFGKISIRNYLRLPEEKLASIKTKPDGKQNKINEIMRNSLDKSVFIDTQKLVCGSTESCPVFTKDLALISFDGGHLTKYGARHVGNVLFKNSALSRL